MTSPESLTPIPEGAVLLHAGLPKTGTTSLQSTFARERANLAAAGVIYPGKSRNHRFELYAYGDLKVIYGDRTVSVVTDEYRRLWNSLLDEVRAAGQRRIMISHECASRFTVEKRRALPEALGRDVHVVVTVRNIADALPSSYQQKVKMGRTATFTEWLDATLTIDPWSPEARGATRLLDYGRDAREWADALGPERVTVIALDPAKRDAVPRAFERLLDLPETALDPGELPGRALNRSLSAPETALLLGLNRAIAANGDFGWSKYRRFVLEAPVTEILNNRTPGADEPKLSPPAWAVERSQEIAEHCNAELEQLGVTVVGDPGTLASAVPARQIDVTDVESMPADLAVMALSAAVLRAGAPPVAGPAASNPLTDTSAKRLVSELLARVRRRATRS